MQRISFVNIASVIRITSHQRCSAGSDNLSPVSIMSNDIGNIYSVQGDQGAISK